jgi:hypothetical protein
MELLRLEVAVLAQSAAGQVAEAAAGIRVFLIVQRLSRLLAQVEVRHSTAQ